MRSICVWFGSQEGVEKYPAEEEEADAVAKAFHEKLIGIEVLWVYLQKVRLVIVRRAKHECNVSNYHSGAGLPRQAGHDAIRHADHLSIPKQHI